MTGNTIERFSDPKAETLRRLKAWAEDQRMREGWGDSDHPTYRYNAETLEIAHRFIEKYTDEVRCDL